MLEFDAEMTRLLDNAYRGADITRRRQASFDALRPGPGDTILDIGCGNGMLTAELARAVGPTGRIVGIDPSPDMLAAGRERCRDHASVEFIEGVADSIPLDDGIADKAVSVQVFEYIEDVDSALDDALRCLKPGGRIVISDLHFGSLIWFSDTPGRMSKMVRSWGRHFASGTLPARLPGLLRARGHRVDAVKTITITDHELKPDGMAAMMMHLMKQYAITKGHIEAAEAQAWFDEQQDLAADGRFFFSITQFVTVAQKTT